MVREVGDTLLWTLLLEQWTGKFYYTRAIRKWEFELVCLVMKGKSPIFSQMDKLMGSSFKVMEVMVFFLLRRRSWWGDGLKTGGETRWARSGGRTKLTQVENEWQRKTAEKLDVRGRRWEKKGYSLSRERKKKEKGQNFFSFVTLSRMQDRLCWF